MRLPRGVAAVLVTRGPDRIVLVSDRLTHDQKIAARVLASVIASDGRAYTMVTTTEVLAALHGAAA